MKHRNHYAAALRAPAFRKRVVSDKRKQQSKRACRGSQKG